MTIDDNKNAITKALQLAFDPRISVEDKRVGLSVFIDPDRYLQHSPLVADGFEGLLSLIDGFDKSCDTYSVEIFRLVAEDDMVVAHCRYRHGSTDALGKACVEIFRMEGGRAVEHWDVLQPVPAASANSNGIF